MGRSERLNGMGGGRVKERRTMTGVVDFIIAGALARNDHIEQHQTSWSAHNEALFTQ
jgi:hypothetical protein